MQDGIINGVGNSRFLKSVPAFLSLYPTYEAFTQALIEGTLPIDLNGINEAGWAQAGTPLNKASLLKDTTAALYGLGTDAVPDDVLAAIKPQLNMSATLATNAVEKLLSVTLNSATANWNIPITLDFDQYTAFLIYPSFQTNGNDPIFLRLNNISDSVYGETGKSKSYFLSLNGPQGYTHQVLLRKAQTYFAALGQRFGYTGYEATTAGGVELTTISSITSLTFASSTTETSLLAGSRITMYGWKA